MAQERILISSDWGKVSGELVDNKAARSLAQMLPLTIEMRDHLRQEKTGNLPSALLTVERQLDFSAGTLGLWNSNHVDEAYDPAFLDVLDQLASGKTVRA